MLKKLNKLSTKLCLFSSTLILAVIGITAQFTFKEARAAIITEAKFSTASFARVSREAFSPKLDLFTLHLHVNGMAKERAIRYALVCDSSGKILSHSIPEKIGERYLSPPSRAAIRSDKPLMQLAKENDGLEYYYFSEPVYRGGERVATAIAVINSQTINSALAETRGKILLISLIALVSAILGTIIIVNWLTRPLPLLLKAARAVGEGHLDTQIKWKSNDEIGLLTSAFNDMVTGLKDRKHIRDVFGRYVSKEVADTLLTGEIMLGGERRDVSVLFADIRDFAKLSAEMEPEKTVQLLNSYFSTMTRIIQAHGGTVDKFIGDGILAIFGAPLPIKDPSMNAVLSALEMQEALKEINQRNPGKYPQIIRAGMSVTSGMAIVGSIGSTERSEYTVIGEPVNLASRLEGLNKRFGTTIITSNSVYLETEKRIKFKSLGTQNIRGWEKPMEVFNVLGKAEPEDGDSIRNS